MNLREEKWTLYDVSRKCVWGGEFKSEAQARRWRNNAELGPMIQPRKVSEIDRPQIGSAFFGEQ